MSEPEGPAVAGHQQFPDAVFAGARAVVGRRTDGGPEPTGAVHSPGATHLRHRVAR